MSINKSLAKPFPNAAETFVCWKDGCDMTPSAPLTTGCDNLS